MQFLILWISTHMIVTLNGEPWRLWRCNWALDGLAKEHEWTNNEILWRDHISIGLDGLRCAFKGYLQTYKKTCMDCDVTIWDPVDSGYIYLTIYWTLWTYNGTRVEELPINKASNGLWCTYKTLVDIMNL